MSVKSQDDKNRIAVDILTKNFVDHARKNGQEVSDSAARKKAVEIAERAIKKIKK